MRTRFALVLGLMIGVAGCSNVKQVPDTTAARTAIDSLNEELMDCWSAGEYECVAAMFAQDGWQLMPNAQAQAGTDAIQRFWQQAFGWGKWEVTLQTSVLEQSGPVAVERGKYTLRFAADTAAPPSRPSAQDHGNYIVHWRFDSDGRWRMAAQALVSEVPARAVSVPGAQPPMNPQEAR